MSSKAGYHRVSIGDEKDADDEISLSSDDDTLTPTQHRRHAFSVAYLAWLVARFLVGAACVLTWAGSIFLAWRSTDEISRARQVVFPQGQLNFIEGGHLTGAPGWGLVYNASYCNGLADPVGARQRGCVFDAAQGGWIHSLCSDRQLLEEFWKLPDFYWYTDFNRTQPISQEMVWRGEIGQHQFLFTQDDFHWRHCEYVVRWLIKHGQSRSRGLGFLALDQSHVNHCFDEVSNRNTPEIRYDQTESVHIAGFGPYGECYMPIPSL